jgi:dynein light intermediate chain 1
LIYTTPSVSSQLPTLVHSSLGVHSILKKQPLKHNVIDRDKVVIPPNWDSWGKIRVLRDGFDVDLVSNGWSIDLDEPFPRPQSDGETLENGHANGDDAEKGGDPEGSTVALYEDSVQDPSMDALQLAGRNTHSTTLEVETIDTQTFLGQQLKVLDAFKQKNDEAAREDSRHKPHKKVDEEHLVGGDAVATEAKVLEHIGPVQFNMGGIQVDADDMVQRLKVSFHLQFLPPLSATSNSQYLQERQAYGSSSEPGSPTAEEAAESTPHMDTENLQAFFHGLMNRRGASTK